MRQVFAFDLWPASELRGLQVVACLQVKPELRRGIEIPRQSQRNRQCVRGQAQRHHKFLAENFTGVNGAHLVYLSCLNGSQNLA